jgi:hypothetical protein
MFSAWQLHARYNRTVRTSTILAAVLGVAAALLSGCKKDIQNTEAVRQGVMNYLAKRSDLLAMDVKVTSVAYRQDEATATVRFQAKGNNSPNAGMTMEYVLERKGGQWAVKGRAGSDAHTGAPQGVPGAPGAGGSGSLDAMPQTLPPGHPSVGGGDGSGSIGAMPRTLPPGHPSTGNGGSPPGASPSGTLPPGHPPISSEKK